STSIFFPSLRAAYRTAPLFPYTTLFRSVRPVKVKIGLTDGVNTEITGGDLKEGASVVLGERRQQEDDATSNPFTPQMFRGQKKRSEEHTSELQSRENLVCRLLLEKKKNN